MTVQSTNNKIVHTALADQTIFDYNFVILQEKNMNVLLNNAIYPFGFSVTGVGDPEGGQVILDEGTDEGDVITLFRFLESTQEIDYKPFDSFPAETHERGLDKLTLLVQQLNSFALGSIRFPLAESEGPNSILPPIQDRALKYMFFDVDGGVGVSEGTAIGGEGVKSISIRVDAYSSQMIQVDNSDTENPKIFMVQPHQARSVVQLDSLGRIPRGLLTSTEFDGIAIAGNSTEMLVVDNDTDPSIPVIGAKFPINAPLSLVQLNQAGLIPPDLINLTGLTPLGPFRGDNLCDKLGDAPAACIVPDHRNPTERFPDATFNGGDFFVITMLAGEVLGDINLFTALGEVAPIVQEVVAGDGIIYFPEILDDQQVVIVEEGWYWLQDLVKAGSAEFITYDPTGDIVIEPIDTNVSLALKRLDEKVLDRSTGGVVTGQVTQAILPVNLGHLANKEYVDLEIADLDLEISNIDGRVTQNEADIADLQGADLDFVTNTDFATATVGGVIKIRVDVNDDCFISTTLAPA